MRCYTSHRAGRETNECVFIKSLSLLRVLQFAEGSGQWWFPRVSREIHQRVHPQVSILRHYAAAAAGAQHRSCGHCESGSLHINMTIATLCLMSLRTWLHLETMPLSYDCWSKSKTWCVSVFFLFFFMLSSQGNDPTALSVLTQAITGQVGFMDAEFCTSCGEKGAEKRCSVCKMVIIWILSHLCVQNILRGLVPTLPMGHLLDS